MPQLLDEQFAREYTRGLVGGHEQVPPQYSAVKVNGKRAYQAARSGGEVQLEPRRIEVYEAALADCFLDGETGLACWSVDLSVSKGTYIRALARDIGREVGCPAHVAALQRRVAGNVTLADCVSLESLEARGTDVALDPVAVLGFRFAFGDDAAGAIASGSRLSAVGLALYEPPSLAIEARACCCTSGPVRSDAAPRPSELVSIVVENRLKAIYAFSPQSQSWKPACVFSTPVLRG